MRGATTSRTSQRAQALGLVQASAGKAARYCFSRSDSVWTTLTSSACVDMVLPSYFDCLPWKLRTAVYLSSTGAIGYAVSSGRSEQAHCVAIASDTPLSCAASWHIQMR